MTSGPISSSSNSSVGSNSISNSVGSSTGTGLTAAFRDKVKMMQAWKPGSVPSNRDKLELYAYHKVAVAGDAPPSLPSTASAPDRVKYQAWRSKSGKSKDEAMRLYIQEADRQMRVYGSTVAPIPHAQNRSMKTGNIARSATAVSNSNNNSNNNSNSVGSTPPVARTPRSTPANGLGSGQTAQLPPSSTPPGLAAIPLLCAAAAESREAYLRRLAQTSQQTAWWIRQVPLCATPGNLAAIPESVLLAVARFLEHITLTTSGPTTQSLVGSFCWPLHKTFLVLWMLIILYVTVLESAAHILAILVWGSRRTGLSLHKEWVEVVPLVAESVSAMCEPHQPLTCRLVGLVLLPFSVVVGFLHGGLTDASITLASFAMVVAVAATWWYWLLLVPFGVWSLLCTAFGVGFCFVLIEFAGV